MSMNYIGRVLNNFKEFYNEINGATLTGAIDVIVVEQKDTTFTCSPFHVRFGKIGVLRSKEKVVDIEINGEPRDIHMKLGESGEAFFVEEVPESDNEDIPEHLATSPIPVSHFVEHYTSQNRRRKSVDLGDKKAALTLDNLENQVNDYTKRRYTADNDNSGREFIKRQITLGNIEVGEASMEDLTLSLQSTNKESIDDLSKDNDISETIFKMDSLDDKSESTPKEEVKLPPVVSKAEETPSENNKGKKKRRKKSVMKKKSHQRKVSNVEAPPPPSVEPNEPDSSTELKGSDSNTDRSSLESSPSETDVKDSVKTEDNTVSGSSTSRKVPLDPDFHFFSDTELTTGPTDSRPNTPIHVESVQSDTEFEVQKSKEDGKETKQNASQSWAWGEFPTNMGQPVLPTADGPADKAAVDQEHHNSMLSNMFSFMKQNKHRRRNSNNAEGVYLQDISSGAIDPEIASLYFTPKAHKQNADADMDCESGNGPSLTQSPNSAEGSKSIDSDFEEQNKLAQTYMHDISISLCGWEPEPTEDAFIRHVVAFSDFCNNPSLFESPNLVVRIRNKYYSWKVAAPIISSLIIYQRPLPQSTVDQLIGLHMPSSNNVTSTSQEKEQKPTSRSWWSWGRSRNSRETTPAPENADIKITDKEKNPTGDNFHAQELPVLNEGNPTTSESEQGRDSSSDEKPPALKLSDLQKSTKSLNSEKCRKTLRLSSEQIAKLNLRHGMNEVEFSVTTAYQGTTRCKCHIYRWKWDDKIVISDIDGTITKSDVLGHILPIVGNDWAQTGVAQLFNKIKDNGYKLLYLSARAIGQARITRDYLKSIKQGDLNMPDGPILLNPTSLITAFHREVIEKKPEQFKISCMSDIKALFSENSDPFYAGYGNRINDVWAYRAVGIPIERIFTINSKGELKHELTQTFQSSYSNMSVIVDQLFPHIRDPANEYSQFAYWREPVQAVIELPPL